MPEPSIHQNSQDDLGRALSPEQQLYFANSKICDENGHLLTMYHGSSYEFDSFDVSRIRANETDAYYNGFWFSSDENTLPAWTKLNVRHEVYLNVTNPAPLDVIRKTVKETRSQWMSDEQLHPESRSLQDEVRYRLQDMGYDGIIHDWKPEVNAQELEATGRTVVTSARGTKYILQKDEKWGGLDLFYYDKDEPDQLGEHLTGYSDLEDYLSLQERTVICFRPEQIKATNNLTPTHNPNFKYNEPPGKENAEMDERKGYAYTDAYGGQYTLYPRLNCYLEHDNLYLGFDFFDPDLGCMVPYCDATVNLDEKHSFLHSCIDTNNNGYKMVQFLMDNGFGKPTGMTIPSGFCAYPVFKFNADKLCEIDPKTFAAYAKAHNKNRKPGLEEQIDSAKGKTASRSVTSEKAEPER